MSVISVENKVVISGESKLTRGELEDAVGQLLTAGVPRDAELIITTSISGGKWAIVAKWVPDLATKTEPHVWINADPAVLGANARAVAEQIRDSRGFRKIKDNPQG